MASQEQIDKVARRMEACLAIQNGTATDSDRLALAEQAIERLQHEIERQQSRVAMADARAKRLYDAAVAAGADVDTNGHPRVHQEPAPIKADF